MELFQIIVTGFFSLAGAVSIMFIAAKAYAIGSDVAEMKDLLKEIRRDAQHRADFGLQGSAVSDAKAGDWPSVADPRYNSDRSELLPYALRPETDDFEQTANIDRPKGW